MKILSLDLILPNTLRKKTKEFRNIHKRITERAATQHVPSASRFQTALCVVDFEYVSALMYWCFTSAYWGECWTLWSKAGATDVVVMVIVGVATILFVARCPMGKGGRCFRGEEGRWGWQRDVWCALCPLSHFGPFLVMVSSSLSAALLSRFNQFDQSFGSRPLAPPDNTNIHENTCGAQTVALHTLIF